MHNTQQLATQAKGKEPGDEISFEEAKAYLLEQVKACESPEKLSDWLQRWGPYVEWERTGTVERDGQTFQQGHFAIRDGEFRDPTRY